MLHRCLILLALLLLAGCAPAAVNHISTATPALSAAGVTPPVAPTAVVVTVVVTATSAPSATPTRTSAPTPTATATPTVPPTATPTATFTPAPTATPTAARPEVTLRRDANLRSGPGTLYPVVGGVQAGAVLAVLARNPAGDWWQVALPTGGPAWLWGELAEANEAAQRVPVAQNIPTPPPTPTPRPTVAPTATAVPVADTVVLGPETVYPVRARRIIGAGYEFVDASERYDLVLHRDVFGAVIRQFWGDELFGRHPHGLRVTLSDPITSPECTGVCKSCPGQPTYLRILAPMRLASDWRGDCYARAMSRWGDGQGGSIAASCAVDHNPGWNLLTDPEECFIAIVEPGPIATTPTDMFVSFSIAAYHWWVVGDFHAMTPDFAQPPFTPHLGQPYRDGDHWRWRDPFIEVVPAR